MLNPSLTLKGKLRETSRRCIIGFDEEVFVFGETLPFRKQYVRNHQMRQIRCRHAGDIFGAQAL
jgi:hypothetical protein